MESGAPSRVTGLQVICIPQGIVGLRLVMHKETAPYSKQFRGKGRKGIFL